MILNTHRNTSPCLVKSKLGFLTAATTLAALLILSAGPRFILAQNLTQADPPATGSADVESRPKFKEVAPPDEDRPAIAIPPREPREPRPARAPRPPRSPESAAPASNIEERLDRLERMVKSLLAQQNPKGGRFDSSNQESDNLNKELLEKRAYAKRDAERAAGL